MVVVSVVATGRVSATRPTLVPTARGARAPTSARKIVTSTSSAPSVLSTSSSRTP